MLLKPVAKTMASYCFSWPFVNLIWASFISLIAGITFKMEERKHNCLKSCLNVIWCYYIIRMFTSISPGFIFEIVPTSITGDRPVSFLSENGPLRGLCIPHLSRSPYNNLLYVKTILSTKVRGIYFNKYITSCTNSLVSTCVRYNKQKLNIKTNIQNNLNLTRLFKFKRHAGDCWCAYRATNNDWCLSIPIT